MSIDSRIVVNFAALPREWPLDEAVTRIRAAGFRRIGVTIPLIEACGWASGVALLAAADVEPAYLIIPSLFTLPAPDRWSRESDRIRATIDAAVQLGAPIVYATTGTGGQLEWDEAVDRLAEAVAPLVEYARAADVKFLLETTNPQFADIDILHTLADTTAVARRVGMGICFDIHASWTGSHLRETVQQALPDIGLVQVSDYVPGQRTLTRAVPGDGMIPIEPILGWVLEGGYEGPFDLELWGSKPDEAVASFQRAARWLERLLGDLSGAQTQAG